MHLPLHPTDMPLHVMNMGGRLFVNKTLSFGSKSSPGLYDRCSWSLVHISVLQSGTHWRHNTKVNHFESLKLLVMNNTAVC